VIDAFTRWRSRRHPLTWLVLPALLLRALIPAGFMPFAGTGGAYLGLCPGAGSLAPSALIGHGHHHHADEERGAPAAPSGSGHHHPACIFSLGATSTAAATVLLVSAIPAPRAPADRADSLVILPTILRAQSSRAPPPAA
jgi:DUF2946 family protein